MRVHTKCGVKLGLDNNVFFCRLFVNQKYLSYRAMASKGELEHEQLYKDVVELVREYLIKYQDRSSKVFVTLGYIIK